MKSNALHPRSMGYRLAIALLALLAAAKPVLFDSIDPDCFWHLRVAGELRANGVGPIVDSLCLESIRTPWTPYSWLAELGMARMWNVAGWRGAILVSAAMSAGFVLLLAMICSEFLAIVETRETIARNSSRELNTILAVFAGCVWSLAYLSFRPATFAIDLLALAAWLIARDRRRGERTNAVWLVLPIAVLLANVHLTAVLLPIGVAAWMLRFPVPPGDDCRRKRRVLLVAVAALGSIATPMLPGVLRAIFDYSSHDVMVASPILSEMRPFYAGAFGGVSAALVGVTVIAAIINHKRLRLADWLLFGVAIALLFRLGRFAPIFAIVGVPIAAASWRTLSDRTLHRRPIQIALAALVAICAARLVVSFPRSPDTLDIWLNRNAPPNGGFPTEAAAYVQANLLPTGSRPIRLANEFNWGGYLGWRLDPRCLTLMDGRTQVQSEAFWRATYLGDESTRTELLRSAHADAAVLPTKGSIFLEPLHALGWQTAYSDPRAVVLIPPK